MICGGWMQRLRGARGARGTGRGNRKGVVAGCPDVRACCTHIIGERRRGPSCSPAPDVVLCLPKVDLVFRAWRSRVTLDHRSKLLLTRANGILS